MCQRKKKSDKRANFIPLEPKADLSCSFGLMEPASSHLSLLMRLSNEKPTTLHNLCMHRRTLTPRGFLLTLDRPSPIGTSTRLIIIYFQTPSIRVVFLAGHCSFTVYLPNQKLSLLRSPVEWTWGDPEAHGGCARTQHNSLELAQSTPSSP